MNKLNYRNLIKFGYDSSSLAIAWFLSYLIRFNFEIPPNYMVQMLKLLPIIIICQLCIYSFLGLNRGVWRFSGLDDLTKLIKGAGIFLIALSIINSFNIKGFFIPRSVIVIFPFLVVFVLGIGRFVYRLYIENLFFSLKNKGNNPLIIIGANSMALSLLKELKKSKKYFVVAILDSDETIYGKDLAGVRVLGSVKLLYQVAKTYNVKKVIVTIDPKNKKDRAQAIDCASKHNLEVLISPFIDQLPSNKFLSFSTLRHPQIEDLLGRDVVDLRSNDLKVNFFNSVIFISGAGGSIGSELCKQLINFKPKIIICFDISEFALYSLEQTLLSYDKKVKTIFIIGDVRNSNLTKNILVEYLPDFVFHAAAYKHVPMVESRNISEAFSNNVIGTYRLALECKKLKIKKFILISTDKAVNPSSIMGVTKRLSEMVVQALNNGKFSQFITVRFGNVLASSGSVIPKFQSQIKAGGPVTVTHKDITRFFMALPEAALLVMQASVIAKKGEVFVLDMGNPIRIVDLAKKMINLVGSNENDIKIKYTGLRPGEKLYEEILTSGESIVKTSYNKIYIAKTPGVSMEWLKLLLKWLKTIPNKKEQTIRRELKKWVKEYQSLDN